MINQPASRGSWAQIGADRTWCWPNHLQPSHLSDLAGGSAPIWAQEPEMEPKDGGLLLGAGAFPRLLGHG
jgi:hypothetical protein